MVLSVVVAVVDMVVVVVVVVVVADSTYAGRVGNFFPVGRWSEWARLTFRLPEVFF